GGALVVFVGNHGDSSDELAAAVVQVAVELDDDGLALGEGFLGVVAEHLVGDATGDDVALVDEVRVHLGVLSGTVSYTFTVHHGSAIRQLGNTKRFGPPGYTGGPRRGERFGVDLAAEGLGGGAFVGDASRAPLALAAQFALVDHVVQLSGELVGQAVQDVLTSGRFGRGVGLAAQHLGADCGLFVRALVAPGCGGG